MRNGRLLNLIGGTILGLAVGLGGAGLSGCAGAGGISNIDEAVPLRKEIKKDGQLALLKNKNVFEYYNELVFELNEKKARCEIQKEISVIDYYKMIQEQYEQILDTEESRQKATESSKKY